MSTRSAMPVLGLSAVQSRAFRILFGEYERRLVQTGYHPKVVRLHLHSIARFGVWIEREGRSLKTIDAEALEVSMSRTDSSPGFLARPYQEQIPGRSP